MSDTLNKIATYLFINAYTKARIKTNSESGNLELVSKAKAIYEKQIKGYIFGIGFFLSFIKGTDAYKAREELYNALMDTPASEDMIDRFGVLEFFFPIINALLHEMEWPYHNPSIEETFKETIFARGEIKYYVHPLNIFKYIGQFLVWITPNKSVAIVTIGILLIPVFILALITELTLIVIDTLIFDPIRFVAEEVKQHYDYRAKEFLYLPSAEYKGAATIFDAFESETVEALYEAYEGEIHREFLREKEEFEPLRAKQNILAIVRPEKKRQCEIYAKSLFFKIYNKEHLSNSKQQIPSVNPELQRVLIDRDRTHDQKPLSKEANKSIVSIYRALECLWPFFLFNHSTKTLPKELSQQVLITCLESATQSKEDEKSSLSWTQ